ncbi:unnamed protein product [Sphagnum balticum]
MVARAAAAHYSTNSSPREQNILVQRVMLEAAGGTVEPGAAAGGHVQYGGCSSRRMLQQRHQQGGGIHSYHHRYAGLKKSPSLLNSVMDAVTLQVSCSNNHNHEKVQMMGLDPDAAEDDDVAAQLIEPTSVLDLMQSTSRPSRSYSSSASLSSQHSFSSSDGSSPVMSTTQLLLQQVEEPDHAAAAAHHDYHPRAAAALSVFKEEHLHAVVNQQLPASTADCMSSISDSDIANWMECLMDPNLAFNVLPEFAGSLDDQSSCADGLDFSAAACNQMKLVEWNDIQQFSSGIGFENFEMSCLQDKSAAMSHDYCGAQSFSSDLHEFPVAPAGTSRCEHETMLAATDQSAEAGSCLLQDEAPMFVVPGQFSEVWFPESMKQKLPHRLTNTRAAVQQFSQGALPPSTTRVALKSTKADHGPSFASMPMQAESTTIVPTSELLKLLSTQQQSSALDQQLAPCSIISDEKSLAGAAAHETPPLQQHPTSPSEDSLICNDMISPAVAPVLQFTSGAQNLILQEENTGLDLVHLLLGCAEAIEACDFDVGHAVLTRLRAKSSPHGDPMKRIAFYFADALGDRLAKEFAAMNSSRTTALIDKPAESAAITPATASSSALESDLAYQASYELLPFEKFTHFTGNQAILEAMLEHPKLHIVDLAIRQGLQWPGFIQALAVRRGGPPRLLRITAVGLDVSALQQTGKRLAHFAESLQVPFEYCVVPESLENLEKGKIRVEVDEILAVNCCSVLHSLLRFKHGVLENVLCTIRALNPVVVSLLEVEANHNAPSFMARFVEALHYYSALFDSLEATDHDRAGRLQHSCCCSSTTERRLQIEKFCFAPQIKDIIACEGNHRRARHVRWETWRSFFTDAGFRNLPLSVYAADQAQLLLGVLYNNGQAAAAAALPAAAGDNNMLMPYKLTGLDNGVLTLGWQDTPVTTVSSWIRTSC